MVPSGVLDFFVPAGVGVGTLAVDGLNPVDHGVLDIADLIVGDCDLRALAGLVAGDCGLLTLVDVFGLVDPVGHPFHWWPFFNNYRNRPIKILLITKGNCSV